MSNYFFIGIIAPIVIAFALLAIRGYLIKRGTLRRCPLCRTVIDGNASVCHACHRDIK